MKIHKLTFENINSYEGRVEIDFENPELQKGNNQFVICGSMGAGKSTILDAITLALYGSTARLDRLTSASEEKSRELINKRSGYCKSVVVYSCKKGTFESTFELRKSNFKVDGNIQPPTCKLRNTDDPDEKNNLLDGTTTKALQEGTEERIGLTYEQFIRCILIPQGEFDKFIESDEREKAGILAKLSHTEHYKQAANNLWVFASEISQKYDNLKSKRDEIQVMSDEDRARCKEEKELLSQQTLEQEQKLQQLTEKITWIDQLNEANKKLTEAKTNLDTVLAKQDEYSRNKEVLRNAGKAADCDAEYRNLQSCINEQLKVSEQQKNAEKELQDNQTVLEEAKKNAILCVDAYEKKKKDKDEQKETWSKVRKLDTTIKLALSAKDEKTRSFKQAKKNLDEKTNKYTEYENRIKDCEAKNKEIKDYLDVHTSDAGLGEILVSFTEKRKAWKVARDKYSKAENGKIAKQKRQEQLDKEKDTLITEKEQLSEELHNLVSSKYMLVADLLRQDLKPGCTCPVCRKEYTSEDIKKQDVHAHIEADGEHNDSDRNDTAVRISKLKNSLDAKDTEIKEKEGLLLGIKKDIEKERSAAEEADETIENLISDLNEMLAPWKVCVDKNTSEEKLQETEIELAAIRDAYKEKKDNLDRNEREGAEARVALEGINLKELQEVFSRTEAEQKEADRKYTDLVGERNTLFGDKNVDEVEKAFDADIAQKENEKNAANDKLQEINDTISRKDTEIKGYVAREAELKDKEIELKNAFQEKLQKNKFDTEEDFRSSLKEKKVMDELADAIKQYENENTSAKTAYEIAKKTQKDLEAENKTTETQESLKEQEEKLKNQKRDNEQTIGALNEKMKNDKQNQEAWAKANEELQTLGNDVEIYRNIQRMLGMKDGSDFEVFVQGIAMHSLLEQANKYLKGMIPKYQFAQKTENSVDFLVQETREDLSVVKRELINFSGGEKFIFSLSLALAMAEFAGQNGDVECIFLDEGFGTLSGEPLTEAINALKRLSTTGKMLGIITHIDAVIQEFNRIEAEKHGESSFLKGPGVTFTKLENKKKKKA